MADILCSKCGMPNPGEQNVCSFCRQSLRVSEDELSIHPGEMPTKKTTADLEPVLPDWLRDARAKARRADEELAADEAKTAAEQPAPQAPVVADWLAGLESTSRNEEQDEIPEWMSGVSAAPSPVKPEKIEQTFPRRQEIHWNEEVKVPDAEMGGLVQPAAAPEAGRSEGLPSWMRGMKEDASEEKKEVSDWLTRQAAAPEEPATVSPFANGSFNPSSGEMTNWLDKVTSESNAPKETPAAQPAESLPDWMASLPRNGAQVAPAESSESFGADLDLPDWMKPPAETPAAPGAGGTSLPDWMASFRMADQKDESPVPVTGPAILPGTPAFVSGGEPGQADELFSIEMPDWLSNIGPSEQKSASAAAGETPQESIIPADLPSWVRAMRPVETVLSSLEAALPLVEGPLEEQGPLAGLRGVLPAATDFILPGKPKAHSIRLQTSEVQQASASLLEQMLASETRAKPISGDSMLASQRALRWGIAAMLSLLIAFTLLAGTQLIPLPAALPAESALILPVLDDLSEGAPVLLVFDYEPALAGELEAAAAPFVDRLIGLRHPRVTILSTSPTGAALAERFMATTQTRHNYLSGQNYVNLGYLPGGMTGVLAFAENPKAAMPLNAESRPIWDLAVVQGVNQFSDYAAVILLTDQAETARAWVEQTAARRNGQPLLVISSAQAAPMIQPYLLSGQVNGLVSGWYGGAAFEGVTGAGSPIRGYWDAYNFATLAAAALIFIGGLWNIFAGVRSRRQGLDEALT
jgi:hypothetical protein